MNGPQVGGGNVIITLAGREEVLTPSVQAAQSISRQAGGIAGAMQAVLKLDLDTIHSVIALGMGFAGTRKPPQDLMERIYRSGLTDNSEGALVSRCILYLRVLANGGRMPEDDIALGGGSEGEEDRDRPN